MKNALRILFATVVLLGLSGCLEMHLGIKLRLDGSGVLQANYVFVNDLISGKYVEVKKNQLIPLSKADVVRWVRSIPHARLLSVSAETQPVAGPGQVTELTHITFQMSFRDIEDLSSNQVKFAYYPYGDKRYFQFLVHKDVPYHTPDGDAVTSATLVNPLAQSVVAGRSITIRLEAPAKILRNDATDVDWATAIWKIPLADIVVSSNRNIVAWAEMPPSPGDDFWGHVNPLWYTLSGQGWRDPGKFPNRIPAAPPILSVTQTVQQLHRRYDRIKRQAAESRPAAQ